MIPQHRNALEARHRAPEQLKSLCAQIAAMSKRPVIPTWSREAGDNTRAERITYEGKNGQDDETFHGSRLASAGHSGRSE